MRLHQPGVLPAGAADHLRVGPHGVGHLPLRRVPGAAAFTAPNPRASAISEIANSGAPQPSMPTADGASPDSRVTTSATRCCNGWPGLR